MRPDVKSVFPRQRCIVPHCNRTRWLRPEEEWICQQHWSVVSRRGRSLYSRVRRKLKRYPMIVTAPSLRLLEARLWARLKAEAIERGMGL